MFFLPNWCHLVANLSTRLFKLFFLLHIISIDRNDALKADAITFYGMHPGMKFRLKKLKQLRSECENATFIFHVREPPTISKSIF